MNGDLRPLVVRKLGAPGQPELAIGAVTADGATFLDQVACKVVGADRHYVTHERARQLETARGQRAVFAGTCSESVAGREAIVVDDGLATGATAIAALRSLRAGSAQRVILAVPVARPDSLSRLGDEADEVVCVHSVQDLLAVGWYYDDFRKIDDQEVERLLSRGPGAP